MSIRATDLRLAARSLARVPTFTLATMLCLGLGIGANTAIYSIIQAVVISPLPFEGAADLVQLDRSPTAQETRGRFYLIAPAEHTLFSASQDVFAEYAAYGNTNHVLQHTEGVEALAGAEIGPGLFEILRVPMLRGRSLRADELGTDSVLISEGLWRERLAGREDVIGAVLRLDGRPRTVVGVVPEALSFPANTDVWVPLDMRGLVPSDFQASRYFGMGRLKPGVSLEEARQRLAPINAEIDRQYPSMSANLDLTMAPFQDRLLSINGDADDSLKSQVFVLLGAVTLLFLIACFNVVNLMLARTESLRRGLALRRAIGAGDREVFRLLANEAAVLTAGGCAAGFALAGVGLPVLLAQVPAGTLPPFRTVSLDLPVLVASAAVAMLAVMAVTWLQYQRARRIDLNASLRESGGKGGTAGRGASTVQGGMIVAQVGLSLAMLVGAALLIKSFATIRSIDLGFRTENMLVTRVDAPASHTTSIDSTLAFYERVLERLRGQPGVEAVTLAGNLPIGDARIIGRFAIADIPPTPEEPFKIATWEVVDQHFLTTLQIPLLAGRAFDGTERSDGAPVVLINRHMAETLWPGQDPIGKRVQTIYDQPLGIWRSVVGVVEDTNNNGLPTTTTWPNTVYMPVTQVSRPSVLYTSRIIVRTAGDPYAVASLVREAVRAADPTALGAAPQSLEEMVEGSVQNNAFNMLLLTTLAGIGLVLVAVGMYGLLAYLVAQRTQELGVRMALGATAGQVRGLVVGRALGLGALGAVIGLSLGAVLARALASQLYQVDPYDPVVYLGIVALMLVVLVLAATGPAWRASRIAPTVALRSE